MSLVFVYSCAFVFVKIYADKSFISKGEPSDNALITMAEQTTAAETDMLPGVEFDAPETTAPAVTTAEETTSELVTTEPLSPEQLVNKKAAGAPIMRLAAATKVSDIEIAPDTQNKAETAAPQPAETEAETTEKPKKETSATTKSPEKDNTSKTAETTESDEEEEFVDDDSEEYDDGGEEEYIDDDESVDLSEDGDGVFRMLTDEEVEEMLERLGVSSFDELWAQQAAQPSSSGAQGGFTPSSGSYKNEFLTIYDTTYGRTRTENAYDLVCEIVNREVGDTFEFEAIKAQAVAAYTYVKYYEQKGEVAEIGTKADPSSTIKKAVDAVDGLAVYYDGKYIMTPFSASQGGSSASSKNVWGGDLPYLQAVVNDFDYLDTKYYGLETTYTVEELRQRIESKTDIKLSENYPEWVRVLSYCDNSVYADQLSIDGHTTAYISGRERTITGHIFRTYVLNLKSAAFTVSYANGVFTFTTYGYGHGVGLSQIGSNLYAQHGYTFDQILKHYFTGVTIK